MSDIAVAGGRAAWPGRVGAGAQPAARALDARRALQLALAGTWLLDGVLSGAASPLNGAPGAVVVYALLAVLLWPAGRAAPAPFTAARAVGAPAARGVWLVLWLSLAWFALTPANRAPQALHDMIAGMESGEPGWLATLDRGAAALVAGQGLAASIALAASLVVIGAGIWLPRPAARAALLLAMLVALVTWVFGEALGAIFTGGGTDPNAGARAVPGMKTQVPTARTRTLGTCRTGKFTELATKQVSCASRCRAAALSVMAASATVTTG
jgi:hypothetical protein